MTGIVPWARGGTGTWIPGSTDGGFSVPCCCDSLSLSVLLPAAGVRSAGAISSGGGCEALGGATGGCVSCGGAGCGFCAPAMHGNARHDRAPSSSLVRLIISPERRRPDDVPGSHGCDDQSFHVFHGASPDDHNASSVVLSRSVSMGCQKPVWR